MIMIKESLYVILGIIVIEFRSIKNVIDYSSVMNAPIGKTRKIGENPNLNLLCILLFIKFVCKNRDNNYCAYDDLLEE